MDLIKPSATILLAREMESQIEVLLLRRNKALAFAGGLWVFPGGKIEKSEIEATDSELEAALLAAVRETKEETNLTILPQDLTFFQHWTTPSNEPKRYATYFFFGCPSGLDSEVIIDDSEIKDHVWMHPKEAIDGFNKKELAMLPPTLMSLQFIHKCQSLDEIKDLISEKEPLYILPKLKMNDKSMICLYEGDAGYENGNVNEEGPRHRLILNIGDGQFSFEYSDCNVPPVNGGMHL